jgi:hypothetical protein
MLSTHPEYLPDVCKTSINLLPGSLKNKRTSSAYMQILCPLPLTVTPSKYGSCLIAWANGSMFKEKSLGERLQPCLAPHSKMIISDKCPFIFILAVGHELCSDAVYHFFVETKSIHNLK